MTRGYENSTTRKSQIVDAARRLIARLGSEHVTVRRIAEEVGITEAAIYRHFKSKREILEFLLDHVEESLTSGLYEAVNGPSQSLAALGGLIQGHISEIEQRKGVAFQILAEIVSFGDKRLNERAVQVIHRYVDGLRALLAKGMESGEIRPDIDLGAAAMLLFGSIQGLVHAWALDGYSYNLETAYDPLWRLFQGAIAKA